MKHCPYGAFSIHYLFPVVSAGFLSVFHGENAIPPHELRIDFKFSCQVAAKRALYSILSTNCTTFAVWMPTRCTGFPSAPSWPCSFRDRSVLSVSRTSLPSQSPSLWQVPSLRRPTACSLSMAVSDRLSRRRIPGNGCCRSVVPAVTDRSVPCTSSGTSGQLSLQEWRTTYVPASASCFSLPDRSSLPSRGEGAASLSCPIRSSRKLNSRARKNWTPETQCSALFQKNFVLLHAD